MTSAVFVEQATPDNAHLQLQELGRLIYAARVAQHLSQLQLAQRVDLRSDAHIGRIENGRGRASPRVLRDLARVLGLDANRLLALGGYLQRAPEEVLDDPDVRKFVGLPKRLQRRLGRMADFFLEEEQHEHGEHRADEDTEAEAGNG